MQKGNICYLEFTDKTRVKRAHKCVLATVCNKFSCKLQIKKLSIHPLYKYKNDRKLNWKRIIDLLVPDQQHKVLKNVTIRDKYLHSDKQVCSK